MTLTDIIFPEDLDAQIEAALETLRGFLLDPNKDAKFSPVDCAFAILGQLTERVSPAGFQYREAGGLMSGVALKIAIYQLSDLTPGDWFRESTTDIKRALVAIELLAAYGKAHAEAVHTDAPGATNAAQPDTQASV